MDTGQANTQASQTMAVNYISQISQVLINTQPTRLCAPTFIQWGASIHPDASCLHIIEHILYGWNNQPRLQEYRSENRWLIILCQQPLAFQKVIHLICSWAGEAFFFFFALQIS